MHWIFGLIAAGVGFAFAGPVGLLGGVVAIVVTRMFERQEELEAEVKRLRGSTESPPAATDADMAPEQARFRANLVGLHAELRSRGLNEAAEKLVADLQTSGLSARVGPSGELEIVAVEPPPSHVRRLG